MKRLIALAAVILLISGFYTYARYIRSEDITVQVTGAERYDGKWIILTQTESFENTDVWYRWKFNSSDLQGRLRPGATCEVRAVGFRFDILSIYRNITKAVC